MFLALMHHICCGGNDYTPSNRGNKSHHSYVDGLVAHCGRFCREELVAFCPEAFVDRVRRLQQQVRPSLGMTPTQTVSGDPPGDEG